MKKAFLKNVSAGVGIVMLTSSVFAGGGQIGSADSGNYKIDRDRITRAEFSDSENSEMYGRSFTEYFDGSCQKELIIDLSFLNSENVKRSLKKQIEAKGHRVMSDSRNGEFPLKTIYFENGNKVLVQEDKNQLPANKQKLEALIARMQQGQYQITMKDLEDVLLTDQEISLMKFKTYTQVTARIKTMIVPQDIMDAVDAQEAAAEKLYKETGTISSVVAELPIDEALHREAFVHGEREVSGLEFKRIQIENLKVALRETKGIAHHTHVGDLSAYVILEALLSPQIYSTEAAEAQSFVRSLPSCK